MNRGRKLPNTGKKHGVIIYQAQLTPSLFLILRYNGRMTEPPATFSPEMEEACKIIENVVNEQMRKRKTTFSREWAGKGRDLLWRANVAASNCYQGGKESVGFHSDQLTYLGPYPTIASLSLGKPVHITFFYLFSITSNS